MKRKLISIKSGLLYFLTIFVLSVFPAKIFSQDSAVRWSTFDVGFGMSASSNTAVKSLVGQGFVGRIEQSNTRIESGFFADSSIRRSIISFVRVERASISYLLMQNYPNPFNPSTTIEYSIPMQSHVTVKIFDLLGRLVEELVNEKKDGGEYSVTWNASRYASGIYLCRLNADNFSSTKKIVLLR